MIIFTKYTVGTCTTEIALAVFCCVYLLQNTFVLNKSSRNGDNMKKTNSFEIDMCNGPLLGKILRFSFPLIFSGVLQLLFNAADMIVVGKFAGKNSLAAVGSTGALINLLVNVFMGLSVGVNVLVARYYGANQEREVKDTVHTAITLSVVCGLFLSIIGIVLAKPLLALMDTPADVIDLATLYMRVYFAGMPVMLLYNFASSILRAVGDTIRPLLFLTIAGVINVGLNLVFVICLHMDVAGVALATVISQAFSAVCVVVCLMRDDASYKLDLRKLTINKKITIQIARIGLPAGLQGAMFSISNVLIQSSINSFGSDAMAGNTAASNLEGFIYTAMNAFHQTAVSFISQNTGARKFKRCLKVLIQCSVLVTVIGAAMCALGLIFAEPLLYLYTDEAIVMEYGLLRLNFIFLTYFTCGLMDVLTGCVRGTGHSVLPMIVSLIGVCAFRVVWIYTVFEATPTLESLYMSYPISWISTAVVHFLCFIFIHRKNVKNAVAESIA